jgi:hypothetical protein
MRRFGPVIRNLLSWPTYRQWLDLQAQPPEAAHLEKLPLSHHCVEGQLERDCIRFVPEVVVASRFSDAVWKKARTAAMVNHQYLANTFPCQRLHPCGNRWSCPRCWYWLTVRKAFQRARHLLFGLPEAAVQMKVPIYAPRASPRQTLWTLQRHETCREVGDDPVPVIERMRKARWNTLTGVQVPSGLGAALGHVAVVAPRRSFAGWHLSTTIVAVVPGDRDLRDCHYLAPYYIRRYTGSLTQFRLARIIGEVLTYPWASRLVPPAAWRMFMNPGGGVAANVRAYGGFRWTRRQWEDYQALLARLPEYVPGRQAVDEEEEWLKGF